jgi:hypothetical protein
MVKVGSEGKEVSIFFWSWNPIRTKVVKDEDWACLSLRAESPEVMEEVLQALLEDLREALVQVRVQKVVQRKVSEIEKEVRNETSARVGG